MQITPFYVRAYVSKTQNQPILENRPKRQSIGMRRFRLAT